MDDPTLPPQATSDAPQPPTKAKSSLGWVLTLIFAVAMFMGAGPGLLLVNKPVSFLGIPLLYAWGLLWYAVQAAVVITAYFTVWREDEEQV